ncbi:polysaccharide pyruvyl transferase family protein [Alteromonas sp. 1_MG-2023]|uniref:polysaccharide pyruvyl transferase family protein n=1 Tax=Alteromonas sp. 1_MG-2023 TaxID=3062669 RepID=UPI0026E24CA3|nr:polysaccharide pyruvyl transferase family protein [Alteromonas sp. 1_MG-2023]MDO6566326.1 polysaccharide pyruvyl transferase family protein [Alteromonas sp. 1_MG-2023]
MYLHYFNSKSSNFGDALNPWFWKDIVGINFDGDNDEIFIGIGTLLNDQNRFLRPSEKRVHVFGTGAGYGNSVPKVGKNWIVHGVRGPLTANAIGVEKSLVLSDPVIYLNRVINLHTDKKYKCSFMPHYQTMSKELQSVVESAGINYISPSLSTEEVIGEVNNSEKIICEAMHGAILAEALRVPWIPIATSEDILSFKWRDFCMSLDLNYNPMSFPRLWGVDTTNFVRKVVKIVKHKAFSKRLIELEKSSSFVLSSDKKLDEMNDKFEDAIFSFKERFQNLK